MPLEFWFIPRHACLETQPEEEKGGADDDEECDVALAERELTLFTSLDAGNRNLLFALLLCPLRRVCTISHHRLHCNKT